MQQRFIACEIINSAVASDITDARTEHEAHEDAEAWVKQQAAKEEADYQILTQKAYCSPTLSTLSMSSKDPSYDFVMPTMGVFVGKEGQEVSERALSRSNSSIIWSQFSEADAISGFEEYKQSSIARANQESPTNVIHHLRPTAASPPSRTHNTPSHTQRSRSLSPTPSTSGSRLASPPLSQASFPRFVIPTPVGKIESPCALAGKGKSPVKGSCV